jgi:hypothetical protein
MSDISGFLICGYRRAAVTIRRMVTSTDFWIAVAWMTVCIAIAATCVGNWITEDVGKRLDAIKDVLYELRNKRG